MVSISDQARKSFYLKRLLPLAVLLIIGALIGGFAVWPLSPMNLAKGQNATESGFMAHWRAGDLVVLVRHAERCDRSSTACLGPRDGITLEGSHASAQLGAALTTLGMDGTDVLSSPLTRTAQTALYMFNRPSTEQAWLVNCDADMIGDIHAHKVPGRNLLLVTHSGCIGNVEARLGFPHAKFTDYNSALFATLGSDGKLRVLGVVNVQDWPLVLGRN